MLLLPALVKPIAARYQVSIQAVDAVGTIHYLAFGLGAVPAGWLADRLGSRRMLLLCVTGCALSAGLVAVAPSFLVFSIGLVGLGVAASVYHPSGLSLISRNTPPEALGRAIGIHGVGGNLGEALAPAAAALIAAAISDRAPFALSAVSALLLLVPIALMPKEVLERSPKKKAQVLWSWRLGLILMAALAGGIIYRGATYFLPRHLTEHVDPSALAWLSSSASFLVDGKKGDTLGAVVTSLALLAGVLAQWWGGRLADRFRRERLFLAMTLVVVPTLLLMAIARDVPLLGAALVFGFGWYLGQPLLNSIAAALVPREWHGMLYGAIFFTSFGLGSVAVSLGSWLAGTLGTSGAFVGFAGVAVIDVILAMVLLRTAPRSDA
jgi:MFS family permease